MSLFKTLFLLCLTLATPSLLFAMGSSYFIEPSAGYRSHTLRLTNYTGTENKIVMTSPVYGLKLGYRSMMGIDLDLAYDYSAGKAEMSPLIEKNNFSQKTAAVQLGINAMGIMKIFLGYGFMNQLDVEKGLLNSDIKLAGLAYQAGLQFKFISFVTLGLQYNLNQFKTVAGSSYPLGEAIETYYNKLDSQDYSASLSISF